MGENTQIGRDSLIGVKPEGLEAPQQGITVIAGDMCIIEGARVSEGENVNRE